MTREQRNAALAASRRGVSAARLADEYGVTRQAMSQLIRRNRHRPSIPADDGGIHVDGGEEVRAFVAACEQAIEDLGEIVTGNAQASVKLGAIKQALDARERKLRMMASVGWIPRQLGAPAIEQEVAAMVGDIARVMRDNDVDEAVVRQILGALESRMRGGGARREALAA